MLTACQSSRCSFTPTRLLLAVLLLGGCTEQQNTTPAKATGGTLVVSAVADADVLLPPLTMTGQGVQIVDLVFDRLIEPRLGDDGQSTLRPALATSWQWRADSSALDVRLDARARWHDGLPVTAEDVRFTWRAMIDTTLGSPLTSALGAISDVEVRGPQEVAILFRTHTADAVIEAFDALRILPRHLLDSLPRASWRAAEFARRPIGSGRFRFVQWEAGSRIELAADTANYRGRPQLDRVVWTIAPDPAAALMRVTNGEADFIESLRPDAVASLAGAPEVELLRSPSLVYGFVQFNLRTPRGATPHPLFGDRALRRALTMSVDRALVVRAVFDSLARVAIGPVTRVQLGSDTVRQAIPFDTLAADRLLDSLGWRREADGLRRRGAQALRFSVLVPSSSPQRQRLAVLLGDQWRRRGVVLDVTAVEFNTMNARLAQGDFDAAVMALSADPLLRGIRGVWSSAAARGGPNFGGYANPVVDALLDSADRAAPAVASRGYRAVHDSLLADAPALWLYEPWTLSALRRSVRPAPLRPDGWWRDLAAWERTASGK